MGEIVAVGLAATQGHEKSRLSAGFLGNHRALLARVKGSLDRLSPLSLTVYKTQGFA
jgi:hypothetical protein